MLVAIRGLRYGLPMVELIAVLVGLWLFIEIFGDGFSGGENSGYDNDFH
jgi:hypothetical protein